MPIPAHDGIIDVKAVMPAILRSAEYETRESFWPGEPLDQAASRNGAHKEIVDAQTQLVVHVGLKVRFYRLCCAPCSRAPIGPVELAGFLPNPCDIFRSQKAGH